MWIRPPFRVLARMPSMRAHPLNPRLAGAPSNGPVSLAKLASQEPAVPAVPLAQGAVPIDDDSAEVKAARAGGFHESSFELQHGLQVSESEWPDDVTMPGALAEK